MCWNVITWHPLFDLPWLEKNYSTGIKSRVNQHHQHNSMAWRKTVVTPVHQHWSYHSHAQSHWTMTSCYSFRIFSMQSYVQNCLVLFVNGHVHVQKTIMYVKKKNCIPVYQCIYFLFCVVFLLIRVSTGLNVSHRDDSRFAPSQWETALLCNNVFHWLDASLESALSHGYHSVVLL